MEQQQEAGKEEKKFVANLSRLETMIGGKDNLKPIKVKSANVGNLVQEMLTEEQEELDKNFKSKFKALVKRYIEYNKFVQQQKREMDAKVSEQMKVFNKEANDLFQMVENNQNLQQSFANVLGGEVPNQEKAEKTEKTEEDDAVQGTEG